MRKYILTGIAVLPLLAGLSQAAQNWSADSPAQNWIFSSEDSGSSSYLGVDISDVTTERLSALKLKEEKGVEVTMVDQDAPAGKAGIKEHDVILSMNDAPIESKAQLQRMIHETPAGRVVKLGLSRDGQPLTIEVQLGDKHKQFAMMTPNAHEYHYEVPPMPPMPDIEIPSLNMVVVTSSVRSGLMMENITQQLGEFFGVKDGSGILVRSVEKGSRAEKAGFRAGDVIVKVNDQRVHDTSDFSHAVKSHNGGSVNVGVVRDKKEQNLNLNLPEHKQSGELIDEDSDDSMYNAESVMELGELRDELAKVRPEIETAAEDLRDALSEGMDDSVAELKMSTCAQQKKIKEQVEKLRKESKTQKERLLQKSQDQYKRQSERLLRQLRGAWMDI